MIDTLNISYKHNGVRDKLLTNLEKVTTVNYYNGTTSFSCKYKDYNISIGDSNIKLSGRIAQQYFGNNFQTITRPQLIETIEELSEHLNCDVGDFKLHRVDVATNFEMDYSPPIYFDYLGQCEYYTRQPKFDGTVYWNQTKRRKLCYDKVKWAKDKGIVIPLEYRGLNIFRYENRLMSSFVISQVIDKQKPLVKHLFEEDTYKKIIDEWYRQWNDIEKIKKVNFNLTDTMKQSDIENLMITGFIDAMGEEQYSTLLQRMKDYNVFKHPSQYSRFKKAIREKRRLNSVDGNPLIEELEMKIGDVEVYYS